MNTATPVFQALLFQSGGCRAMGSELNAVILQRAADDWLAGGPVRDLMAPWADLDFNAQLDAATPLRLIGALHELALSGADPPVSAAYDALDAEAVWTAAEPAMVRHAARLAAFMSHEPQTNEVRRSICLLGGFLQIAKATGLPLRCFEIAASAGLNLSWDRYRYRMGDAVWGDRHAVVAMDTDWSGPPPATGAKVSVMERAACDRRPIDLTDTDQRRRLLAYIWADQTERLARIRAAIDLALARGVSVEAADAVEWARAKVAPQAGTATVLYHSVFWQYMPAQSQAALSELIAAIGVRATPDAPFAWLRLEPNPDNPENNLPMQVRLTLWPDGAERVLAQAHPHGAWVRWAGD